MITYRKAKQLLAPGDHVYIVVDGRVEEQEIVRIHKDTLLVRDGYLYFDDAGLTWWLTRLVAQEKLADLLCRR